MIITASCVDGQPEGQGLAGASSVVDQPAQTDVRPTQAGECEVPTGEVVEITTLDLFGVAPTEARPRIASDSESTYEAVAWEWLEEGTENDFRQVIVQTAPAPEALPELRATPSWARSLGFPQIEELGDDRVLVVDMEYREGLLPETVSESAVDPWYQLTFSHSEGVVRLQTRGLDRERLLEFQSQPIGLVIVELPLPPPEEGDFEVLDSLVGTDLGNALETLDEAGYCVLDIVEFPLPSDRDSQTVIGATLVGPGAVNLDVTVEIADSGQPAAPQCGTDAPIAEAAVPMLLNGLPHLIGRTSDGAIAFQEDDANRVSGVSYSEVETGTVEVNWPSASLPVTYELPNGAGGLAFTARVESSALLVSLGEAGPVAELVSEDGEVVWTTPLLPDGEDLLILRAIAGKDRVLLGFTYPEGGNVPARWVQVSRTGELTVFDQESGVQLGMGFDGELLTLADGRLRAGDGGSPSALVGDAVWILGATSTVIFVAPFEGSVLEVDRQTLAVTEHQLDDGCFVLPARAAWPELDQSAADEAGD